MNSILVLNSHGHIREVRALIQACDLDAATETLMLKVLNEPAAAIREAKQGPGWQENIDGVEVITREIEALDTFSPTEAEADAIKARFFASLGTDSEPEQHPWTPALRERPSLPAE